jgi:hypothetical protein
MNRQRTGSIALASAKRTRGPSPTFVATFAGDVRIRMTTFHDEAWQALDLRRAVKLSIAAFETRERNRRTKVGETVDAPIAVPPIVAGRFESSDDIVLKEYSAEELAKVAGDQLDA